jgi:hypothetical protein
MTIKRVSTHQVEQLLGRKLETPKKTQTTSRKRRVDLLHFPRVNQSIHSLERDLPKFHYGDDAKKPCIPGKDDKPIMGLVSDKNYVVANAVENILAAPKMAQNKDKDFLKKKAYGRVPKYLENIKQEIEDEYKLVRDM